MKVCASCRYWGGKRDVSFGQWIETFEDKGECMRPYGGFYGVEIFDGGSCPDWEPFWPHR